MRSLFFGILAFGIVATATPAHAGEQSQSAYCSKNADGSGYCQGTFLGFRNYPDNVTYAYFSQLSSGAMYFVAQYGSSVSVMCSVYSQQVINLWPALMAGKGFFSVNWDKYGDCTSAYVRNSSLESNF